jgi:hypothetical protein
MAHIENARSEIIKPAPKRAVQRRTLALVEPSEVPLTYGSWMELGLAARQTLAAADQLDTFAMPAKRRG